MKSGTKLKRIARNSESCRVFIGETYTVLAMKDGYIRLEERRQDGYAWDPKNFKAV